MVRGHACRPGHLSFVFCTDDHLLEINRKFLQHDYYTDIITFDYSEGNCVSGDLMISIDRVKENAFSEGVSFENELHRVMIHGVLHLIGFGDKSPDEAEQMRKLEASALFQLSASQDLN